MSSLKEKLDIIGGIALVCFLFSFFALMFIKFFTHYSVLVSEGFFVVLGIIIFGVILILAYVLFYEK